MTDRTCPRCGDTKAASEFSRNRSKRSGLSTNCKGCERSREREAVRSGRRDLRSLLVTQARGRAKATGIPFDLEPDDLLVPELCPVLGIPLRPAEGRMDDSSPTLDRIIPTEGYVRGNVVVVSWRANRLKSNGTLDDFRRLVDFYELIMGHTRARRLNPA